MKSLFVALVAVGLGIWGCGSDGNSNSDGTGGKGNGTGGGAGTSTKPKVPECLGASAWYLENIMSVKTESATPTEPGQKTPNAFGLYDMLGNTIEWVQDCYHETYAGAPVDGSAWQEASCDYFVVRGGCSSEEPAFLRVSARASLNITGYGGCSAGVRCVTTSATPSAVVTWVDIPGGSFTMGCSAGDTACEPNEQAPHLVTVPAFKIMAMEATQKQYFDTVGGVAPTTLEDCPTCAMSQVYHDKAQEFCAAIGGRLPSEAEWEYAARGGTTTAYYCGG